MDCARVTACVRKAKKKQVKGELDRLKLAEKKKRRLEKALATSAAIRSELEKKKAEQERLDEEGAAIAEAVALHVLLGEDSEDSGNVIRNKGEGLTSLDHARQIDVIFGRRHALFPCHDQPCYSFESMGRASDAHTYGQMQDQSGNSAGRTDPQEEYFYSLCYEEDGLCSADLVAAQAVSSLNIADDAQVDAYVFNHILRG